MSRLIAFATGSIWKWGKSLNHADLLDYIEKLDVQGVELTFDNKKELFDFKLSSRQTDWLKSLSYVSIHAPFNLVSDAHDFEEIIEQLDVVKELYDKTNAKNVIIHPNNLPDPDVLSDYSMHISTENLPKKRHIDIKSLEKIIKKYDGLGFCLDTTHAYTWNMHETGELAKRFKSILTQVHFSGSYRRETHVSLRDVSSYFIKSIQPLKQLNVPIVIEGNIEQKNSGFLREEIAYIRKWADTP